MTPESASPPPSFPRFETMPYRPDGGFSPAGSAFMVCAAVVSGLILGLIASVIGQWFYLVLVFPVAIGIGMGAVCVFAIQFGKVRSPMVAGLAGFLGGCMAMFTMHYGDYQRFLGEFEQQFPGIRQRMTFVDFMDLQATQGVTIGKATAGNKDRGMNLGYTGSLIYWLVEALIVAGIAFAMARSSAAEPFCRQCRDWKEARTLGGVSIVPETATQALNAGDLSVLYHHLQKPDGTAPTCVFQAAVCKDCGASATVDVKVSTATQNDKGEVQLAELAHVTYPGEALAVFEAVFAVVPSGADAAVDGPGPETKITGEAASGEPQTPAGG